MATPKLRSEESLKETFFVLLQSRVQHCRKELAAALASGEYIDLVEDGFTWNDGHFSFHAYRCMERMMTKRNDLSWSAIIEDPDFEMCLNQVVKQCHYDSTDHDTFLTFFELFMKIMWNNHLK